MVTLSDDGGGGIEFDVPVVSEPENWNDAQSITTHPDFPTDPSATIESPFISASMAFGGDFMRFSKILGEFHSFADQAWPILERAYGFYLQEKWDLFDRAMAELLGKENWPDEVSMLRRYDVLHRVLSVGLLPLGPSGDYPVAKKEIWAVSRASIQSFGEYCAAIDDSELAKLQRRLFDQIRRMMEHRAIWSPALALTYLDVLGRRIPNEWRLPGDDFHILRDAYRQNYEVCCQILWLVVAAKNTEEGRPAAEICSPDYSFGWVPQAEGGKKLPKTLAQYKKATSEVKELYLDKFPSTRDAWDAIFNRSIRNAIAHADADFVIETGMIATGKGDDLSYMDFVKSTVGQMQMQMLMLFIDYVKLCRIYGHAGRAAKASQA
ncbi:hypothetical protein [Kribbella sp. NPDC051137]|uniref:hypothetical protein n=1 Tax=Kribbella sp. NPDC051137 TaxID=3155045 RepID=UPI0034308D01